MHVIQKQRNYRWGLRNREFTYKRHGLASRLQKLDLPGQYRGRLREPRRDFTRVRGRPAKFRQSEFSTHTER